MNHGFVRVCAATPKIQVADPEFNGNEILKLMEEAGASSISDGVSGALPDWLYL